MLDVISYHGLIRYELSSRSLKPEASLLRGSDGVTGLTITLVRSPCTQGNPSSPRTANRL
jgi:hypothetical protein